MFNKLVHSIRANKDVLARKALIVGGVLVGAFIANVFFSKAEEPTVELLVIEVAPDDDAEEEVRE